jgi:3-hydroxy acid dehydrogenase/malonic semialdehyde reductase
LSKTVFVTGATGGFGEAIARRFISAGARVVLTGRREERLAALTAELGPRSHAVHADVRDQQAMANAVAALPADFAAIDVLVNNAGIGAGIQLAQEASLQAWNDTLDTNVRGMLGITHAILPGMVKRNRGHIVNIGSTAAHYPQPAGNVYGGTKAFLHQFSLGLRCDLLGTNVRVSCLEPGFCETDFTSTRLGDAAKAKAYYEGIHAITAEEVADMLFWLVSLPGHINVNVLEVMPTRQALAGYAVSRDAQA